ncbi:MAG: RNA ligase family protein [Gemmatimonadales bacterium]|nr:RNA ligase family protein [Gemmatimonadales bacterium]
MEQYHKILTAWLRDPDTKFKTLLHGQWAREEFGWLAANRWLWTEKVDGTNIRVMWDGEKVRYGGKTDRAQIPAFLVDWLMANLPGDKFACSYPQEPLCLYGEGYGAKIQKGGGNYIHDGVAFVLFDVRVGDVWLERENVEDVASLLSLNTVPVVGSGPLTAGIQMAQDGFASQFGTARAEGLVMRPAVELLDRRGRRIITKVKHKDFSNV